MNTWAEVAAAAPELSETGRALVYQFGVGLGFLATVQQNGGPRLHPICPVITAGGRYAFIHPSPKRDDLLRRGHYALHSLPGEQADDEFSLTGRAVALGDPARRATVIAAYHRSAEEEAPATLFAFLIERALLVVYRERGDPDPKRRWWRSPAD